MPPDEGLSERSETRIYDFANLYIRIRDFVYSL